MKIPTQDPTEYFSLYIRPKTPKAFRNGEWRSTVSFARPTIYGIVAAAEEIEKIYPDAECEISHLSRIPGANTVEYVEPDVSFPTLKEMLGAFRGACGGMVNSLLAPYIDAKEEEAGR